MRHKVMRMRRQHFEWPKSGKWVTAKGLRLAPARGKQLDEKRERSSPSHKHKSMPRVILLPRKQLETCATCGLQPMRHFRMPK